MYAHPCKSYQDRDYDDVDERGWLTEWMGKFVIMRCC